MINKKKGFYLEDYDSNFDYLKKRSRLNISFNRVALYFFIFYC